MGNIAGLYKSIIADPRLKGCKPAIIIIGEKDEVYISIKDAAQVAKLSTERLRGLVSENRIDAIKPGGRDLFVSLASVDKFVSEGRKEPGRPRHDSLDKSKR